MQYNKYRSLCTAQGAWHPATELQPTGGNTQENQTSSWKMQTWGIMNLQREVTLMKHYRKQLDRFKLSWHPWNVVPINQDYSLTVKSVCKRLDIKRHRGCCSCSFAVCLWNHCSQTEMLNKTMLHNPFSRYIDEDNVFIFTSFSDFTVPLSRHLRTHEMKSLYNDKILYLTLISSVQLFIPSNNQ